MPADADDPMVGPPRTTTAREWEVFVRADVSEPLRRAGSVTAATAETAREAATDLFDRHANALWLCPADEVHRVSLTGESPEGSP